MWTVILSILTLAASFGISYGVDAIERKKLEKNASARDVQSIANAVMTAAQKKGSQVASRIAEKINSLLSPIGISSTAENYMREERKRLSALKDEVSSLQDKQDVDLAALQGKVSSHEMLTQAGKTGSIGKTIRGEISRMEDNIADRSKEFSKIEKEI